MNTQNAGNPLFRIAASTGGGLLDAGRHIVTIMSIVAAEAVPSHKQWSDPTPQAKVVFKNENGMFTEWLNLSAYKRFSELSKKDQESGKYIARTDPDFPSDKPYAVIKKTGVRVVDNDRTETAHGIIAQMIGACGFEKGTEVEPDQLIGKTLGIVVKDNGNGKLRARSFYRADAAKGKAVLQEA